MTKAESSNINSKAMGEEIAISLNNVSKCYKRYARPVDRLKEILLPGKNHAQEFWALENINLEVPKGQTLGIIGKNGSGKSTLLKIITGTLTPTSGEVKVAGCIAALLELGSGFNPEFTGRQNVFFNGQLLGLSKQEIEARFDNIAAFADIGQFLDQPVKTYSSGMYVRLAFAVFTSIEPDILIVDEALAVGDEAFQRKCFSRIESIQEKGGTILFVSHTSTAVIALCKSAILVDCGNLLLSGSPKFVFSKYHQLLYAPDDKKMALRQEICRLSSQTSGNLKKDYLTKRDSANPDNFNQTKTEERYDIGLISKSTISYISRGAKIEKAYINTSEKKIVNVIIRRREYIYTYSVSFTEPAYKVRFGMLIKTVRGIEIGGAASHTPNNPIEYIEKDEVFQVEFRFRCFLYPGVYFLNAGVVGIVDGTQVYLDRHIDLIMFRVQLEEDMLQTGIVDFCIEPSVSVTNSARKMAIQ
jgi:lipopolysaccharide transport system ATP-binding protein